VPAFAVKVAVVEKAATDTALGVVSSVVLLDRATEAPLAGAAALRVTVHVLLAPEARD